MKSTSRKVDRKVDADQGGIGANAAGKRRASRAVEPSMSTMLSSANSKAKKSAPKVSHVHYLRHFFKMIGEFSACQQWEAIVAVGILLVLITGFDLRPPAAATYSNMDGSCAAQECHESSHLVSTSRWAVSKLTEYLILYAGQILAILHIVYRVRNAYHTGSALVLQIGLSYLVFTFMLFGFITTSLHGADFRVIQDSWYIVFLLIDIPKVTRLAQFVLASSQTSLVSRIVARGMYVLAPSFLIDTLGKILLFGLCALTNVHQLVMTAWYACVFNLLNLLVFISLYPATLALSIELMHSDGRSPTRWDPRTMVVKLRKSADSGDSDDNSVVHRVKMVGIALLSVIHMYFFWPITVPTELSILACVHQFLLKNLLKLAILAGILAHSYWSLFADDAQTEGREVLNNLVNFLHKQLDYCGDMDDSEIDCSSSCRSEELISSSTDEGIATSSSTVAASSAVANAPTPTSVVRPTATEDSSSSDWSEISLTTKNNKYNQRTASLATVECNTTTTPMPASGEMRPLAECVKILKSNPDTGPASLTDEEVISLVEAKHIRSHALEKVLNDYSRGVEIRRKYLLTQEHMRGRSLANLPYKDYDYELVMGACAESVIGVMTLPVGCVGPLKLDGKMYHVPMATTEGCLVASTNRGCSALAAAGGVTSYLYKDGMTRAPVLKFRSINAAVGCKEWMETDENFQVLKSHFDSTSRFARLSGIKITMSGVRLYVRFVAVTGDAMGMNMLSKATEHALSKLQSIFPDMSVESLSGNMCTDKKPSAVNWVDGRGKSVVCEAIVPADIVEKTLKTTTKDLVELNISKNYIGSAMAGSIGGFNAHAANIVTAIFIATGQDTAQTVESSNCITTMEATGLDGRDLHMTVTMPSIEVGTVGGGTVLAAQKACLDMLGVRGPHPTWPGENARQLARIIAATVLAGELSLMSALAAGHLVRSHLRHNRSSQAVASMASVCSSLSDLCQSARDFEQKRS